MAGIGNIINAILKARGIKQNAFARLLGKSPTVLHDTLKRGMMSVPDTIKMLDLLGYEIVVQPISAGKRKKGQIKVDSKEMDKKQALTELVPLIQETFADNED